MQESSVLSVSPLSPPSFNSYSSEKLSDIAARVVEELRKESESDPDSDIFNWAPKTTQPQPQQQQQEEDKAKDNNNNNSDKEKREYEEEEEEKEDDDDDFEFAFVCREPDTTTISADEIFSNGQIRPTYPIFDQSLLLSLYDSHIEKTNTTTATTTTMRTTAISTTKAPPSSFRRPPLRKLMIEEQERDRDTSCSSSEADDLEGVPDGSYCVWTPHSSSSCKKSHSTGSSSKRWRFRDLLYRSNSDGKDTFVFLTPSKKAEKIPVRNNSSNSNSNSNSNNNKKTTVVNKVAEENKRKSFLPYRKDLVGFFTNANGLSKSLQPF
ncbi:uncharacterized protein LOC126702604 [Quercus robur]|uniref:uncharacterized protein LOC126702604 n=1 Tax=Quercus robur TaxID=38942 RepID=UPI00216216EA|nr:uncharacterized protein LOC126702604 [Quercus robur]